jgi:hypothetical protein
MALKPVSLSNLSRSKGFVNTTVGGRPGYGYDINRDEDVPGLQGTSESYDSAIGEMSRLPAIITGIYNRLRAAGRDSDAWLLRDAAERFSNSGAAVGVNAFGRARALSDLQARLMAAANQRDAGLSQQESAELARVSDALGKLGVQKATDLFNQGMQRADFREGKDTRIRNAVDSSNAAKMGAAGGGLRPAMPSMPTIQNQVQRARAAAVPAAAVGFQKYSREWANEVANKKGGSMIQGRDGKWYVNIPTANPGMALGASMVNNARNQSNSQLNAFDLLKRANLAL